MYTHDLANVIMLMLSVEPKLRPSCAQILEMDIVKRKIERLFKN